jgi:hypothetical protein
MVFNSNSDITMFMRSPYFLLPTLVRCKSQDTSKLKVIESIASYKFFSILILKICS